MPIPYPDPAGYVTELDVGPPEPAELHRLHQPMLADPDAQASLELDLEP